MIINRQICKTLAAWRNRSREWRHYAINCLFQTLLFGIICI